MTQESNEARQPAESIEEREAGTSGDSGSLIGPNSVGVAGSTAQTVVPDAAMSDQTEARGDQSASDPSAQRGPANPLDAVGRQGDTVFQRPDPDQLKPDASSAAHPMLDEDAAGNAS